MTLAEIRTFPTTVHTGPNRPGYHESIMRSYQLLLKVKELLTQGTPPVVLLEIIEDAMNAPGIAKDIRNGIHTNEID